MSNILIVGFVTEGTTDVRFLESIIARTFVEISSTCVSDIDIYSVEHIPTYGDTFVDKIRNAVKEADRRGVMVLCVHSDADSRSDYDTFQNRIKPAFDAVNIDNTITCKALVPLVPVAMSESWMLADVELLKGEICTTLRDYDLGLHRSPETIADPKEVIVNSLRIASEGQTRRRGRSLSIGELYQPLGQKLCLTKLEALDSYSKFKNAVRDAFTNLNYLY